jgi:6-phosphofructokinase 1
MFIYKCKVFPHFSLYLTQRKQLFVQNDMRIGILTSGGDCPGINATIRGVCKTAIHHYGMQVTGIHSGFQGLLNCDVEEITDRSLSGLLNRGGTFLGTSREKPFKDEHGNPDAVKPARIVQNIQRLGLDCVVCIGGNGTQKTAARFAAMGVNIVSIPKTIDNDICGTDISFGFDTAVTIATDAIDRLHSTASSHKRVMVIEVMGHKAGWIALYSGMAGGGDVILLPELPFSIERIAEAVEARTERGRLYSIVVVAEGIHIPQGRRAGEYIAAELQRATGIESRDTVLGYIQRGGAPTPFDRNLSTRMGGHATSLIAEKNFGRMIALRGDEVSSIPLAEIAGKRKLVTADHDLVTQGRRMGVCFG